MKPFSIIILLLFPLFLWGQPSAPQKALRSAYYNAGMKESIHYYDSVLNDLVQVRYQSKMDEATFVKLYGKAEQQYKAQQQKVAALAEKWLAYNIEGKGKNIKSALAIMAKSGMSAAIRMFGLKLKELNAGNREDFKFQAEMLMASGQYPRANALAAELLKSKIATAEDRIFYVGLVSRLDDSSKADEEIDKLLATTGTDTLLMAAIKVRKAAIFKQSPERSIPLSALIEAQYLLEQYSVKDSAQKHLLADVLNDMAASQLESNDFDNAVRNSRASVEIFEELKDDAGIANAKTVLALIYKRAGGNKEADAEYKSLVELYERLSKDYPERYEPLLAEALDAYGDMCKWFDRNAEYEKIIRQNIALRKELRPANYPFFRLDYAKNLGLLAHKLLNTDIKVYLAEAEWQKEKEVLTELYKAHPMLAGDEYCTVLYKLGVVKMTLKRRQETLPFLEQDLAIREYLSRLSPAQNKVALMNILFQNASLNHTEEHKNELAIEQLSRAKMLADELGEKKFSGEIQKMKLEVLQK